MRRFRWLAALALAALLLARPKAAALGALAAMERWRATVAPAIFPFLALMPLLTGEDAARAYRALLGGAMGRLFRLPGAAAPAMVVGMVAGTPAGAIASRGVAARAGMNRGQLHRLSVAVMGFSPGFLVGGVGEGMLGSAALGWRLALSQLLTQLTLALLLRGAWRDRDAPVVDAGPVREEAPVRGAVLATLTVCGYMALFGALSCSAGALVGPGAGGALLCLLDAPSGAHLLANLPLSLPARMALISALCGFGGLCVIAQCLGALRGCDLRASECLALRALAGALSAGFTAAQMGAGKLDLSALAFAARENPLAVAGLCASALAVPALVKLKKSIS